MARIFLFDVDLTMIRTNRAGSLAMTETLREMAGIDDGFAGVEFGGRSDRSLLREALTNHDRLGDDFDAFVERFKTRYVPCLARHLAERGGDVLPGVVETLDRVAALADVRLGLATGNFRAAAEVKLRYFELWERFQDGGFADDGEERADLVAEAIRRLAGDGGGHEIYILGDSTWDIAAAKANGAVAIGVATGGSSTEILAAAGADFVFDDLRDPDTMLRLVLGRDD
jgi:phosphoglycolate phosphatase-like HAD superfamily hydrolase